MLNQRSDKVELLRIAESVAIEKSIDKEIILNSMETAIQKAAKTRFGSENDIRAKIDRESGDITLHKVLKIVEKAENLDTEISLKHSQQELQHLLTNELYLFFLQKVRLLQTELYFLSCQRMLLPDQ